MRKTLIKCKPLRPAPHRCSFAAPTPSLPVSPNLSLHGTFFFTLYCFSGAKGIDVYDRDELIKAVCLHAQSMANNGHNDNSDDERAASASAVGGMAPASTVPAEPPSPRSSSKGTAEKNTAMSRLLVRKDETSGALTVIVDNNAEEQDNVCRGWRDMMLFHPCRRPKKGEILTVRKGSSAYRPRAS